MGEGPESGWAAGFTRRWVLAGHGNSRASVNCMPDVVAFVRLQPPVCYYHLLPVSLDRRKRLHLFMYLTNNWLYL